MSAGNHTTMSNSPLASARAGLDLCVHCGFCLQSCPTYLALEDENDSPRGRLVLMNGLLSGEIAPEDPALNEHISRCLGCRGCETACPSGVPYGHLLEATRATLNEHRRPPIVARMVLAVFSNPLLLRLAMLPARALRALGIASLLARGRGRIAGAFAMLASTAPGRFSRRGAPGEAGEHRGGGVPVALFEGCVMRELYAHVHQSSRAVLGFNGYRSQRTEGERCCGALHAHSGDIETARSLARANIVAFEQGNPTFVAVNAAGCGAMLKEYPSLFAGDPEWHPRAVAFSAKVRDISELLASAGPVRGGSVSVTIAYDAPCHLVHAQRVTSAPLAVLRAVPGAVVVQTPGSDRCCGAAGIYNLLEPSTAAAVLQPKLGEIESSFAQVVCTGNPGCMMQIGAGLLKSGSKVEVAHPVELLDYSYRKATPSGARPTQGPG